MCIKWRLKLPFCLFCRLCSISLESLLPFWVFPRSELATSPLFWGGERSLPAGSRRRGQQLLWQPQQRPKTSGVTGTLQPGALPEQGQARGGREEGAGRLCKKFTLVLHPACAGTLWSLWNWHLSVLNAVQRSARSHEGWLRGGFLPRRSCSTEQEDLKMNVRRAAPGHLPGRAARRQIDCKRPRARVACSLPGLRECCGVFWCNLTHTSFPRNHPLVPCNRRVRTNSLGSGFSPLPSSTTNPFDSD